MAVLTAKMPKGIPNEFPTSKLFEPDKSSRNIPPVETHSPIILYLVTRSFKKSHANIGARRGFVLNSASLIVGEEKLW